MTSSRRQFGIRPRLFLAFGAVAGTTVIACATAWVMFLHVGALLDEIATRDIPGVVATLQLSTDTQALVTGAPNLLNGNRGKSPGDGVFFSCADSASWILCIMCRRHSPFPR